MIRNRQFHKLTELSVSILEEIAVDAQTHWKIVMVRSLIYVLGIGSIAYGVFAASLVASLELSDTRASSPQLSNYLVGLIVINVFTSAFILTDSYWNHRNRNLLQIIPLQSEMTYYFLFVPLSIAMIVGLLLNCLEVHSLNFAANVSSISLRLLCLIFVAAARQSCDTGEELFQTLLRYATIIFSITSLTNLFMYDLSLIQAQSFKSVIFNSSTKDNITDPLMAVVRDYQYYSSRILLSGSLLGVILLLEPVSIQWRLVQQRLICVRMSRSALVQSQQNSPANISCQSYSVIHWLCSLAICGSLLGASILMLIEPLRRDPYLISACVAYTVAILVTIYHLIRLQHSTTPRHNLLPNNLSYLWLNVDILLTCVGLFGFILKIITNFVLIIECFYDRFSCPSSNKKLLVTNRTLYLLQIISQGVLLLTHTELEKTKWSVSLDTVTYRLLSPLHYLALLNITFFVSDVINYREFISMSGKVKLFSDLYRAIDSSISFTGVILFRIFSASMLIRFIVSNDL